MNKITKAQRDKLIGIGAGSVAAVAALWFFVVTSRQAELRATQKKTSEMRHKLADAESLIRRGEEIETTLTNRADTLAKREANFAPDRDTYAWMINTITPFVQQHPGVHMDSPEQPVFSDTGLIPNFPYRQASFRLKGSAYYQDWGRFFADLENAFPYFRIENPNFGVKTGAGTDGEKLSAVFEIVTPVIAAK